MLPKSANAEIPIQKIRDDLLSSSHPIGRFKATYFRALGFTGENSGELVEALQRLAETEEAIVIDRTKYGQKYIVRGRIKGPNGRISIVESVWIVLNSTSHPRLITAYPGE